MLSIASGIILALFILGFLAALNKALDDRRDRRNEIRHARKRVHYAETNGFIYDPENVTPYEDQLNNWHSRGLSAYERARLQVDAGIKRGY